MLKFCLGHSLATHLGMFQAYMNDSLCLERLCTAMLISHTISWTFLKERRDFNANKSDTDVEFEYAVALFFHAISFVWIGRCLISLVIWKVWTSKTIRKDENHYKSVLINRNTAQWTFTGWKDINVPKIFDDGSWPTYLMTVFPRNKRLRNLAPFRVALGICFSIFMSGSS